MRRRWHPYVLAVVALGWGRAQAAEEAVAPPPLPAGATERFADEPIFRGKLRIVEAGKDNPETVVLVHGIGDAGACDWYDMIPSLAHHFHVIAFDLPGFARSGHRDTSYTPMLYATFIKWLADTEIHKPFYLVGHSLGAAVALRYAAVWPADLHRLVLVDAAGILFHGTLVKMILQQGADKGGFLKRRTRALTARFVEAMSRNMPIDLELLWGEPIVRRLLLNGMAARSAALALIDEDYSSLLGRVRVPTQLIWGADDTIAPVRTGEVLEAMLPDARLELISGSGHEPMREKPELFSARLAGAIALPLAPAFAFPPVSTSDRVGTCKNESGKVFTGEYLRIELDGCDGARIVDASVGSISANGSELVVERSRVEGAIAPAIRLRKSELTATALLIRGDTGIVADDARLDLAGVEITAANTAIYTEDKSQALFSDCRVHSPYTTGGLHGAMTLTSDQPF